jgi:hypothetical protein
MAMPRAFAVAAAAAAMLGRAIVARARRLRSGGDARGSWLPVLLITTLTPTDCQAQFGHVAVLPPINSGVFAARPPAAGMLNYLQSIKFIDDSIRYKDPYGQFFVSSVGEMCFRIWPNSPSSIYEAHYSYWCVYPQFVGRVESSPSVNAVVLWCKHAYPQCIYRDAPFSPLDYSNPIANSLVVQTVTYWQTRNALEHLIYLMGGDLRYPDE